MRNATSRCVGRCKILGRPEQQIFAKRLVDPLKICAVKSDKKGGFDVQKNASKVGRPEQHIFAKIWAVKSDKQNTYTYSSKVNSNVRKVNSNCCILHRYSTVSVAASDAFYLCII